MSDYPRTVQILLVDDSPTDADLAIRALRRIEVPNYVHHVNDGVKAMAFLRREDTYHNVPRPDLVLLDLNMPRMDGRQVLQAVRADDALRTIPIVILTTSDDERDVTTAYGLFSNAYVVKPVDVDRFFVAVQHITEFWFRTVRLPQHD